MRLFLLFLILPLLPACATLDGKQRASTLEDMTAGYTDALRWADFTRAEGYRRLPAGAPSSPPPEALSSIRVTSCRIDTTRLSPAGDSADVEATISFYADDIMKLRTVHDHQHWRYDAAAGTWYITTPLPDFRTAH